MTVQMARSIRNSLSSGRDPQLRPVRPHRAGLPGGVPGSPRRRAGPPGPDQRGDRRHRRHLHPHREPDRLVRPGAPVRHQPLGAHPPGRDGLRVRAHLGEPPRHPRPVRELDPDHHRRRRGEPEPHRRVERALARVHVPRRRDHADHAHHRQPRPHLELHLPRHLRVAHVRHRSRGRRHRVHLRRHRHRHRGPAATHREGRARDRLPDERVRRELADQPPDPGRWHDLPVRLYPRRARAGSPRPT